MKTILKTSLATALLAMAPMVAMADVTGLWQTEPNAEGVSGIVQVSACGDAYCGVMIGNSAGTDKYKGQTIISGMKTTDGVSFSDGKITDPTEGKTYNSKMTLNGNTLKVEGCILSFCRAQNWVRAQ